MQNWSKIVENAISTTVALIVVSAGAIVWKAAMSVDQKIDDALTGVNEQGATLHTAIDIVEKEIIDLRKTLEENEKNQKTFFYGPRHVEEEKVDVTPEADHREEGFIQQQLPADYAIPRGQQLKK